MHSLSNIDFVTDADSEAKGITLHVHTFPQDRFNEKDLHSEFKRVTFFYLNKWVFLYFVECLMTS